MDVPGHELGVGVRDGDDRPDEVGLGGVGRALGMSPRSSGSCSSPWSTGRKAQVDLAVGIAMGSSLQIALSVTPVLVLASHLVAPDPLPLGFSRIEIGALFLRVLVGSHVAGDGRSNWYKGVHLAAFYLILATMFYLIPPESAP